MVQSKSQECDTGVIVNDTENEKKQMKNVLRIVDYTWDVCVSNTPDGSIAVFDGSNVLLTPLGINTVPPPMSMYRETLSSPIRHAFFWPRTIQENNISRQSWGLACLCDGDNVQYLLSCSKGKPMRPISVDIKNILQSLNLNSEEKIVLRGIAATEIILSNHDQINYPNDEKDISHSNYNKNENEEKDENNAIFSILLYGSKEMKHVGKIYSSYVFDNLEKSSGQGDVLLTLIVRLKDGIILKCECNSNLGNVRNNGLKNVNINTDDNFNKYDPSYVIECDRVKSRISRIALCPGDLTSLVVSTVTGVDTFDVYHVRATREIESVISNYKDNTSEIDIIEGMHTLIQNTDYNYNGEEKRNEEMETVYSNKDYQYGAENNDNNHGNSCGINNISTPSEICIQIAVIPKAAENKVENEINDNNKISSEFNLMKNNNKTIMNNDIIIGLSSKGKLYCGEILLVAGVSSFTLNIPLEVLMYVSTGTRPHLHFCSFEALRYVLINSILLHNKHLVTLCSIV